MKEQSIGRRDEVAIRSANEASYFLACMNEYLLPRAGRMHYAETTDAILNPSIDSHSSDFGPLEKRQWLIICAHDDYALDDLIHGRQYRADWEFAENFDVPSIYREVYTDMYYRIFRRFGRPTGAAGEEREPRGCAQKGIVSSVAPGEQI